MTNLSRTGRLEREMARARTRVRRRKLLTYVIVDRCRHRLVAGDRARAGERASVIDDDDSKVGTCHPPTSQTTYTIDLVYLKS